MKALSRSNEPAGEDVNPSAATRLSPRVAVVGTVGIPANYGGFETLVDNLVDRNDIDFVTFCSRRSYSKRIKRYKNSRLIYLPFDANGWQSTIYDAVSLFIAALMRVDTILVLGVSGAFVLPLIRLMTRAKIVTNVDGIEWRRAKWNRLAKVFLRLSERLAVRFSHCVIADNAAIKSYLDGEYGVSSQLIAYGGDHAVVKSHNRTTSQEYALSICRIEPENNVDMLLEAFSHSGNTLKLKIVGNWKASEYGRALRVRYANTPNLELIDAIYDLDVLADLRAGCKLYVHGHSAGGTNPSLVEIMHFGKPVLAFRCAFNVETTCHRAAYFDSAEELRALIGNLDQQQAARIGSAMKEIAESHYTWGIVSAKYARLFAGL